MKKSLNPISGKVEIEYLMVGASPFSFALEDSDYRSNQVILDTLVGTIVKFGPTGKLEPYLAKSWTVSSDELVYDFFIHEGLQCSDGYELDAETFVESFVSQLSKYAKKDGRALEFEKLKGWVEFKKSNDASVLGVESDKGKGVVRFTFSKKPDDILNFFRMPYFGFFSPKNFDDRGDWKNKFEIISCGGFELDGSANQSHVVLKRRANWHLSNLGDVEVIRFRRSAGVEDINSSVPTVVDGYIPDAAPLSDFYKAYGLPNIMWSVILSPKRPFFADINRRLWLKSVVEQEKKSLFKGIGSAFSVTSFFDQEYTQDHQKGLKAQIGSSQVTDTIKIQISPRFPESSQRFLLKTLEREFSQIGLSLNVVDAETLSSDERAKLYSNELVDIRVGGVSVGPSFDSSVYNMMFCSDMGVGFPDPSGRVCDLVKKFESASQITQEQARLRLTQVVEEDAAVIPLARDRLLWYYSKHFDPTSIVPIPNYPRFDLLRLQK